MKCDLFDHVIQVVDPYGTITLRINTPRGSPIRMEYPDGVQEFFKYDLEGSLHRHCSKDGTVRIFEYDYMGRNSHIEHYARSQKESGTWLSSVYSNYDAFHLTGAKDEDGNKTTYSYDGAGRLMHDTGRRIPIHILDDVINSPMRITKDPQGASNAMMYYSRLWRNGKLYNVEVLYEKASNRILHFQYSPEPVGPLKKL